MRCRADAVQKGQRQCPSKCSASLHAIATWACARSGRITWQTSLAGVAVATVLAVALGQHAAASTAAVRHRDDPGSIVIPAQPPQPSAGSGQVTSGAS